QIDVAVEPDVSVEEMGVRLREALPAHLGIATVEARRAEMSDLAAGFAVMVNAMSAIGLVLAILITANRLSTIYLQRHWELSVLRGQGMSTRSLVRNLLVEAGRIADMKPLFGSHPT
ncbi:MAG: hypothetical protein P8R42_15670, partial [Candidatus Binatia bacterium]|nr:hypothetical protein [Candidatus Binatia bacterium]